MKSLYITACIFLSQAIPKEIGKNPKSPIISFSVGETIQSIMESAELD